MAVIANESQWNPRVVGGLDRQCVGLGQMCLHVYPECTASFEDAECQKKRAELQDPAANIHLVGVHFAKWRKWCLKKTGHARLRHLYFAYGGWNSVEKNIWCGQEKRRGKWKDVDQPKTVKRVVRVYLKLARAAQGKARRKHP